MKPCSLRSSASPPRRPSLRYGYFRFASIAPFRVAVLSSLIDSNCPYLGRARTLAAPPPPTAAPQKPLSFRFHFTAAAQASLHRPAPRTRSRATLIPLLRPLDRRKELLSHISPASPTALTCHPALSFRSYHLPLPVLPATPFLLSANLKKPNREATPVPQCSQPHPPVHQVSPSCEALRTGGTLKVRWRQFTIEQPPLI